LHLALDYTFINQFLNFKLIAFINQKWLFLFDLPMNCLELRDVENVVDSPLSGQCQFECHWTYNLGYPEWSRKQSC
jgi:hypothetical protein